MDKLLELAERCEAATGPNADLAREIYQALGHSNAWIDHYCEDEGQDPTASLDAAMTLVPVEWHWSMRKMPLNNYLASLFVIAPNGSDRAYVPDTLVQCYSDATPALALCAAALRACASQKNNHE